MKEWKNTLPVTKQGQSEIKDHMKFKYSEYSCRWCGVSDETVEHIVNCGHSEERIENVEQALLEMKMDKLSKIASRIDDFISKVEV